LGGQRERLECLVLIATKRNAERLAAYFECSITDLVERLINERTELILSNLNNEERDAFLEQKKL